MVYSNYEVIINKDNPIKKENVPKKMISVGKNTHPTIPFGKETNDILLEETAAGFLNKMLADVNSRHANKIIPDSGFRSFYRQERLINHYNKADGEQKTAASVAPVGTSEHHTGLAIDVAMMIDGKFTDDITGDEPEIIDLISICYKYGFILRYPKGKEIITSYNYEPWHFRFVGLDLAKKIHDSGLTLEEVK